jgi:hypothetical protein
MQTNRLAIYEKLSSDCIKVNMSIIQKVISCMSHYITSNYETVQKNSTSFQLSRFGKVQEVMQTPPPTLMYL